MNSLKNRRAESDLRRSLHSAAVLMVAFALAIAVATRYTDHSDAGILIGSSLVQHHNLQDKRQHIEKTSLIWIFALMTFVKLKPPTLSLRVASIGAPLVKVFHGEDLYNRPPPFLS